MGIRAPKYALPPEVAAHHAAFLAALRESIASDAGGEIVARWQAQSGRVFVTGGRVAWITSSSLPKTLREHLAESTLLKDDELKEVVAECKRSGSNFAETIVAWELIDAPTLRGKLLEHLAANLLDLFAWPSLETLFVPIRRTHSGTFTFSVNEILRTAVELGSEEHTWLHYVIDDIDTWFSDLGAKGSRVSVSESEHSEPSTHLEDGRSESMDVAQLKKAFEEFKTGAADGLLASDIFTRADATPIIGFKSNAAACALFNRVIMYLDDSLRGSKFPPINRYIYLELVDNKSVVLVNLGSQFVWGMLCDTSKIQLGMLLNVLLPDAIIKIKQALDIKSAGNVSSIGHHAARS